MSLDLAHVDPDIARLIADENRREDDKLRLIASENYASQRGDGGDGLDASPTSTPRATRASATTRGSRSSTRSKSWPPRA